MARSSNGPWFRKAKNSWFVWHDGRQQNLKVKGAGNRAGAVKAWHRLMAGLSEVRSPDGDTSLTQADDNGLSVDGASYFTHSLKPGEGKPTGYGKGDGKGDGGEGLSSNSLTVKALAHAFLADAEVRVTAASLRGYTDFLAVLVKASGKQLAEAVDPDAVEALSRRPQWSPTYRASFLAMVGMAYRWAVRRRLLSANPMAGLRKPHRDSRGASAVVKPEEHARLLRHAQPATGELLAVLWATGARPSEVFGLTAEQVRASADGVIPVAKHKTAHKGKSRFLILQGPVWAKVRRRAKAVGSGLLWPSEGGGQLTAQAFAHRLKKLCRRAGVRHLMPYGYRHAYATEALAKGVPDAQVAALLGHSSTAMLHRHYSHLTGRADVLRQAAALVRG